MKALDRLVRQATFRTAIIVLAAIRLHQKIAKGPRLVASAAAPPLLPLPLLVTA